MRRRVAEFVTGVAAAVLVFAAVPAVLVAFVGLPIPQHWDRSGVLSARGLFDLLAILAWVAWAACCWPLLRSVASRVRRRDATVDADARLPDWLATRIAAAVLAVATIGLSLGTVAGASDRNPSPVAHVTATAGPVATYSGSVTISPTAGGQSADDGAPVPAEYTVVAGDTLWSIAEHFYGDGAEWSAIAQANLGDLMDDGSRFIDPSLILPGWALSLPQTSTATTAPSTGGTHAGAASATGAAGPNPDTRSANAGAAGGAGGVTSPVVGNAGSGARAAAVAARVGGETTDPPAGRPGGSTQHLPAKGSLVGSGKDSASRSRPPGRRPAPAPAPVPLPEVVALGVGVLVAAVLARRARKARHMASLTRPEGQAPDVLPDLVADTATLLAPFDGAPVLDRLEMANRHLTGALLEAGHAGDAPAVRLVRIGPDGVEIRLTEPVAWAPGRWTLGDGPAWHLSASVEPEALADEARGHDPWLPVLLPVGDNDEGTWLVPVEPGSCLPVIGPLADGLVSAMRFAVESWSWSERVAVIEDPTLVDDESRHAHRSTDDRHAQRVLFLGDPTPLPADVRARCGVLTTLPVPATDLTVVIDQRAASLHPIGVTVRPHLLYPPRESAVAELLRTPEAPAATGLSGLGPLADAGGPGAIGDAGDPGSLIDAGDPGIPDGSHRQLAARPPATIAPRTPHLSARTLGPGPVEVRLLTAIPRIDGLVEELPAKRARRTTELVAYLALHQPDPVTSDRLRTRVLGSADADAAAKTLFNTAGAGRRAMGRDSSGDLFLPAASKTGHYRVSPLVTVDVTRASSLVVAAEASDDPEQSMALLRAALDLVEGEPLAGILSGYAWWSAEGHERRVAATLVDGACRLARLAVGSGYLDLARWGLEQARLVEPYSEALTRVAMQVAAEAGDADRLRREWVECQRRVDELDPGSLPSEATERIYADLRRQAPAYSGSSAPSA